VDWSNERYVRVYTRDTTSWLMIGWEGQALLLLILRKVDRAGIFEIGKHGLSEKGLHGIAAFLGMPDDVVSRALPLLLEDGCVELSEDGRALVIPNFIEAQEASMSGTARQQESRLRRRDMVRCGLDPDARETVIYFIQSEHGGPVKIGHADDLAKRLVGLQTARPDKLVVLATAPGSVRDERAIHAAFAHFREKGEWFSPHPSVMAAVSHVATTKALARDWSQFVTGHSVPCRTEPSVPEERVCGAGAPPPIADGSTAPAEAEARRRADRERRAALEARVGATEAEFLGWFNRHFHREFQGSKDLRRAIRRLLADEQATMRQMQAVAWLLKGKWENDPKMRDHLIPISILRPDKWGSRLDEARERFDLGQDDAPVRAPEEPHEPEPDTRGAEDVTPLFAGIGGTR
jgi:hypothetical protein